jgi:hypothetical protein
VVRSVNVVETKRSRLYQQHYRTRKQRLAEQTAAKQQQEEIAALRAANAELNKRLRLIERTLKNKRGPTRRRR